LDRRVVLKNYDYGANMTGNMMKKNVKNTLKISKRIVINGKEYSSLNSAYLETGINSVKLSSILKELKKSGRKEIQKEIMIRTDFNFSLPGDKDERN
jgi:hypothetical protein